MVFQHFGLFPCKSVYRNVALPLQIARVERSEAERRVADALATVGLTGHERKYPAKTTKEDQPAVAYAIKFLRDSGTWPNGAGLNQAAVNYTAGVLARYKDIPQQPSFSQIVDPSYANAAAAKVGSL